MSVKPAPTAIRWARAIAFACVAGLVLGITAQLLRQVDGSAMSLGAATAPWLTIGFFLAVWATRADTGPWEKHVLPIVVVGLYLLTWLLTYHATFAIRESVTQAAAWREAAPWLFVAVPASVILGFVAAATHKDGVIGDVALAVPVGWSIPEIALHVGQGWSEALVVALPAVVLALSPILAVRARQVSLVRVLGTCVVFGVLGLAVLPIARSLIRS